MVDAGVLEQILIDSDRAHYRISTGDGSSTTLIDPESGKMLPVDDPQLNSICREIATKSGWSYRGYRIQIMANSPEKDVL